MARLFPGDDITVDWSAVDRKMRRADSDFVEVLTQRDHDFSRVRLVVRPASTENLSVSSGQGAQKEHQRIVHNWPEVVPGMFVYLKYIGFWHAVLVTGKDVERSVLTAVHYRVPKGLLQRRTVSEDEFHVDLTKKELWEVVIPDSERVSPEVAVRNARSKVGEQKFNMFTRRSSHVVRECLKKEHSA